MNRYDANFYKTVSKKIKKMDSVILPKGMSENILGDVTKFINSEKWYLDVGIPYRRGYCLHGPPGKI